MDDENVVDDNSNTSEETTPEVVVESETEEAEESVEDLKAKLAKAEEVANNQRIRAEKAERKPKEVQPQATLNANDLVALMNAKVHEDDVSEIEEYARFKKISIAEALKSGVVKSMLGEKNEQRYIANATHTGPARKGNTKIADEALLKYARDGRNVEDPVALAEARWKEKHKGK